MLSDDEPRGRTGVIANIITPRNYQFDFKIDRSFALGNSPLTASIYIQNFFNRKNVQQVYWRTGSTEEDGSKELLADFKGEEFLTLYQFINIDHRQEYGWAQGGDLFGKPREIRFGLQMEF